MNKSPKLLILLGVSALILFFGIIWNSHHKKSVSTTNATKEQAAFDVASGDTNNEVLRSIVAQQNQFAKTIRNHNAEIARLAKQIHATEHDDIAALSHKVAQIKQNIDDRVQHQLDSHQSTDTQTQAAYQLGEEQQHQSQSQMIGTVSDISNEKSDTADATDSIKHITSDNILPSDNSNWQQQDGQSKQNTPIPFYTVPDGSTIGNVVLMSPLIAEVPVSGQLKMPAFPFKAIISHAQTAEMFSANGIPLPDNLSGTILQGYSVGDMSLSCARAYVTKILFVFNDGHFQVYPKNDKQTQDNQSIYPSHSLGYLSDQYNNPCISGRYITNAPQVITSLTAFGTVAGIGGALAQSQTQTFTSQLTSTTSHVFNGNLGKYAAGMGLGQGAQDALAWYKSRVNDIFDAVFVPSSINNAPTQLVFNITQTIPINLDKNARTLQYDHNTQISATDHSFE